MEHCINSLLVAGEEAEIIIIDDGSSDDTGKIADDYQQKYPTIVKAIHQENGGHGEGVNQGLRNATGVYYKVVDSDDWLDKDALLVVLDKLRSLYQQGTTLDLMITDYVYDHVISEKKHTVAYLTAFPLDTVFTWQDLGHFHIGQYLLMHSCIYRTQLLKDCDLQLPKHTFYVDNVFVYQPLPHVQTMYYMHVDLYHYFIGREDQSVNERVMVKRIDQQITVTHIMTECQDIIALKQTNPKLAKYMFKYLAMMYTICSVFLIIDGSKEALDKREKLMVDLKAYDETLYKRIRYRSIVFWTYLPGSLGRKITVFIYHIAQKIGKFN